MPFISFAYLADSGRESAAVYVEEMTVQQHLTVLYLLDIAEGEKFPRSTLTSGFIPRSLQSPARGEPPTALAPRERFLGDRIAHMRPEGRLSISDLLGKAPSSLGCSGGALARLESAAG